MKPGDQIYVWRDRSKAGTRLPLPYQPHGIYAGDGQVIHLCGEPGLGRVEAEVRFDDLGHFSRGSAVEVVRHDHQHISRGRGCGRRVAAGAASDEQREQGQRHGTAYRRR